MTKSTQSRQLLKILIGAAWIDGVIQSEERQYLKTLAANLNLQTDEEIVPLLSELKPISATDCYTWINDYLGNYPSEQDYQTLLETMSGLLYSDGNIQTQEAQLLASLQDSDPQQVPQSSMNKFLGKLSRLYRQAVKESF